MGLMGGSDAGALRWRIGERRNGRTDMRLGLALALFFAFGCTDATLMPFRPIDPGLPEHPPIDDPAVEPGMDDTLRIDLLIEGLGFEPFEGAVLWTEVFEIDSPPLPAEVVEGVFSVSFPASYEPGTAIFLTVAVHVDFDHDDECTPGDVRIYAPATIVSDDPAFAFAVLHIDDPDAIYEPCEEL